MNHQTDNESNSNKIAFRNRKIAELLNFVVEEIWRSEKAKKDFIRFLTLPSFNLSQKERIFCKSILEVLFKNGWSELNIEQLLKKYNMPTERKRQNQTYSKISSAISGYIPYWQSTQKNYVKQMPEAYSFLSLFRKYKPNENYLKLRDNALTYLKNQKKNHLTNYYYFLLKKLKVGDNRHIRKSGTNGVIVLKEIRKNLIDFYIENDLIILCEIINRTDPKEHDKIVIPSFFKDENLSIIAQIFINFCQMHLHIDKTEMGRDYYFKSKQLLTKHENELSVILNKMCYSELLQFCAKQNNKGNKFYTKEYIELIKAMEKSPSNLLLDNNIIQPGTYKNIVTVGLTTGDDDFVEQFIEKYYPFLQPYSNSTYSIQEIRDFHLAEVWLYRGNLDLAFQKLPGTPKLSNDFYYNVSFRRLKMKLYYQLGNKQQAEIAMNQLKEYLRSSKQLPAAHKVPLEQFIQTFKELINASTKKNNSDLASIKKPIQQIKLPSGLAPGDAMWLNKMIANPQKFAV